MTMRIYPLRSYMKIGKYALPLSRAFVTGIFRLKDVATRKIRGSINSAGTIPFELMCALLNLNQLLHSDILVWTVQMHHMLLLWGKYCNRIWFSFHLFSINKGSPVLFKYQALRVIFCVFIYMLKLTFGVKLFPSLLMKGSWSCDKILMCSGCHFNIINNHYLIKTK